MSKSREASNVYAVIAAHFVDVFYNGLFTKASNSIVDGYSIRDTYRTLLAKFARGLKEPKYCASLLTAMHNIWNIVHSHVTHAQFLDLVMKHFVPAEAIESMSANAADAKLYEIVRRVADLSINYILTPQVYNAIIDDHSEPANVEDLKQQIAAFCTITREAIHTEYTKTQAGTNNNVTIDASALANAAKQIRALKDENEKIKGELKRTSAILAETFAQYSECKNQLSLQMQKSAQLMAIVKIASEQKSTPAQNMRMGGTSRTPMRESVNVSTPVRESANMSTPVRESANVRISSPHQSIREALASELRPASTPQPKKVDPPVRASPLTVRQQLALDTGLTRSSLSSQRIEDPPLPSRSPENRTRAVAAALVADGADSDDNHVVPQRDVGVGVNDNNAAEERARKVAAALAVDNPPAPLQLQTPSLAAMPLNSIDDAFDAMGAAIDNVLDGDTDNNDWFSTA